MSRIMETRPEAAKRIGCCVATLAKLTKQGAVPHVRLGASVRYPSDLIDAWIMSNVRGPVPEAPGTD